MSLDSNALRDRPYASCRETVYASQLRKGYGVESMRLNPTMSTRVPLFSAYDEFDYDAFYAGNDNDIDDVIADEDEGLAMDDHESAERLHAGAAVIDESYSSRAITKIMERVKARDRAAIKAMQHDVEHRCIVNLLKCLEDAQCPDYMLQSILQWAYDAKLMGFNFNPRAVTRKANVQWMYRALQHSHQCLPQVISVHLEDHDDIQDIVCFDFAPALLSLLQDDNLMQADNLVINIDDPTSMYVPSDNKFGEANTGERYRELFRDLITSRNQLLVPIIMYLDGTHIDSRGHIEICPVSFTTSLFSEKVRRDHKAWRLLGYVPDLNRGRSSAMNDHDNRSSAVGGRTTRNFHSIMDVILKGMAVGQAGNDCRLKKVPLKVGYRWIVVDIVCPLLFVINDGKQGDQLCGRANGHHPSQRRHHRSCDCQFDDLDNPDVKCTFLTTDMVTDLCRNAEDDVLHNLTLYRVDNAFNRIQMGKNAHGIFMCAVIDVMHTVQNGIIMYAMNAFKNFLNSKNLQMLDRMAIAFDKTCCQSIRSSFPRTDFARGITNLTEVECSEQSGALFLFCALIMQVKAWQKCAPSFPNLEAVLGTMECILCFEAWVDQPTFWNIDDKTGEADRAEDAIASMMKLIVKWLPRQKGNEWKVSKLHEIKHIVRFIVAFGSSRGYNASRPEEHHKAHAKNPGRRSFKNVKTIDQQCGRRIADAYLIDTMHALFQGDNPLSTKSMHKTTATEAATRHPIAKDGYEPGRTVEEGSGTRYRIRTFLDADDLLCREVIFDTESRGVMKLEKDLARFIVQSYSETDLDVHGEGCILCCTEYHKYNADDGERLISLRCHPNYRSKGYPWYDWAIIRTENNDGSEAEYPSRILSCIPRFNDAENEMTYDLVVQFCDEPSGRESFLFTEWLFNSDYYVVSATALVGLCFVLVSSEVDGKVLVVKDRAEWASTFHECASVVYEDPEP
jgi:hypothetical protein